MHYPERNPDDLLRERSGIEEFAAQLGDPLRSLSASRAELRLGLGFPIACFALLIADRHPRIGKHPILATAALASVVGALVIVGWWKHGWRTSEQLPK